MQTQIVDAIMATLNPLAYEEHAEGHDPVAIRATFEASYGERVGEQITDFGEDHNFGWLDSGTLDALPRMGAAGEPARLLFAPGAATKRVMSIKNNAFWVRVFEQSKPSPDGTRLVLVEINWAHSDSAATYGGLFKLAAE